MTAIADHIAADGVELAGDGTVPVALPRSEEELLAVLARASAERARVVPTGGGTKLAWCRPEVAAGRADLLLSLRRLDAVVDYVPGDGTLTARAGATMARLEERVAEGGHRLTPAVADADRATLGGVLSSGISGPDRTGLGPARHHVLGTRVALADGRVARSGGRLVKNVSGFELHRLFAGSRGTLAVLLEASMRLFPTPEHTVAVRARARDGADLLARAESLRLAPLTPLAAVVQGPANGTWHLDVVLAGRAAQVEDDLETVRSIVGSAEVVEGAEAERRTTELAEREGSTAHGWPRARLVALPARLPGIVAHFTEAIADRGGARIVAQPWVASVALFDPDLDPADERARLMDWQAAAMALGGRLDVVAVHPDTARALAPQEGAHPSLGWMERLRAKLDPQGCLRSPFFPTRS